MAVIKSLPRIIRNAMFLRQRTGLRLAVQYFIFCVQQRCKKGA